MSIKRYKDIASMQNPGSQRTGKAGGGRVKKQNGGRGERAPILRGAAGAARDVITEEGFGGQVGGIVGSAAERIGRGIVGGIRKRKERKRNRKPRRDRPERPTRNR